METRMTKSEDQRLEEVSERPSVPPRADIFENENEYLVVADVPGANADSLDISLDKEQLTMRARIEGTDEGTPIATEYRPVDYYRRFLVPKEIDRDQIAANLENGVLQLHLPKSSEVKPRRIEVKSG